MPEGDTIYRAARTLERVLAGKTVRAVRSPLSSVAEARLSGLSVEAVEARGKNLLIHFDDGRSLYTHMRMTGSWHIYRPGETWQKPQRLARVVLETDDFLAVCFSAPRAFPAEPGGPSRARGTGSTGEAGDPAAVARPESGCAAKVSRGDPPIGVPAASCRSNRACGPAAWARSVTEASLGAPARGVPRRDPRNLVGAQQPLADSRTNLPCTDFASGGPG